MRSSFVVPLLLAVIPASLAGPIAYGIYRAGCASVVMACYAAAEATWVATLGATAPATVIACNPAFGSCSAACAVVALALTPRGLAMALEYMVRGGLGMRAWR